MMFRQPIGASDVIGHSLLWCHVRLMADYLHLSVMIFMVASMAMTRSVEGFSLKSQAMWCLVFSLRYLDLFFRQQILWLILMKIVYLGVNFTSVYFFFTFDRTYDERKDRFKVSTSLVLATALALISWMLFPSLNRGDPFLNFSWTLSEILEPVAILPQLAMSLLSLRVPRTVAIYIIGLVAYRAMYVIWWIELGFYGHPTSL